MRHPIEGSTTELMHTPSLRGFLESDSFGTLVQYAGELPASLGKLGSLQELSLFGNELSGEYIWSKWKQAVERRYLQVFFKLIPRKRPAKAYSGFVLVASGGKLRNECTWCLTI